MQKRVACALWAFGAGWLLAGTPAFAQTAIVPVAVTGYTDDVVANGNSLPLTSTSNDFDNASYVLMEKGYSPLIQNIGTASGGLPTGGLITSATGSGATYQLASYSANNSLRGGGTLTLSTPQAATTLYLLAATGSGSSNMGVTVTFTDNTTQVFSAVSVPDWYNGSNYAIQGLGRVSRASNALIGNDASNPRLYEFSFALSPANTTKSIQSVTTTQNGGVLNVMGVSVAPTAIITSISPGSAGAGVPATLTGVGLAGATSLVINGAPATILTNMGTAITFRVPAGASATGTSSVTTPNNTATSTAFTYLPAPGNALAFDGADDYVSLPSGLNTANFTFEAWINYQDNGGWTRIFDFGTGTTSWMMLTAKTAYGNNSGYLGFGITANRNAGPEVNILSTTPLVPGRWQHVAVTLATTAGITSGTLYLNGQVVGTNSNLGVSPASLGTLTNSWLGRSQYGQDPYLKGSLDEVRIYNAALTQAQVQADMASTASAAPGSLAAYYSFDEGTPATASTGANTALTTLYNIGNGGNGTLTNFSLASGNTTSNWVESYALVVPTAAAATGAGSSGFTANWTAPALGSVASYYVDVATNATFSAGLITRSVAAPATSLAITGLAPGTTYYYRVRADKASVTGQGAYSATMVAPTCAAPLAVAQNVTLTLDANGNATLGPSAANNGSTANCGLAPASALSVSRTTFSCADLTPTATNAALTFSNPNQSNQYVDLGSSATMPVGNSAYTIEAWVKPTQMGQYGIIGWGNYGNNNQVNALRLSPTGLRNYWWSNDLDATTADLSGAWHHVAASYDPATNTRCLYLDGALVSTDQPSTATPHAVPNADNLRIGSTNFGEFFPGSIDEVRVWSVTRTAAQIAATRSMSIPGSTTGLVAYYRLNENGGTTVADATGTAANAGTLVGSPTWTVPGAPVAYGQPVALTVTDNQGNTSTAPLVVTVVVPVGTTAVAWNGAASTDWMNCHNWSYGLVPSASVSVTLPGGQARYPSLTTGTYPVSSITIAGGASLASASGAELQVNGDLNNSGTISLSGPVTFVGAAATQALGGSSATSFGDLAVRKASGTVQLGQSATVTNSLTLTSGLLDTKAYQLTLAPGATISETDASYVLGSVAATRTLAPGSTESFGGLGLSLTPALGSTAPGSTPVVRTTGTALAGVGTSQSILRYFTITPANKTGLNVSLVFSYFAHELATSPATPEANLALFKSETGASNSWLSQNPATLNTSDKTVTKTGITSFSIWTLANSATPLPVELVSFAAAAQGPAAVRLTWTTASELHSRAFEVERSADGVTFAKVGQVAAAGTSATTRTYSLLDAALPAGASRLHYRLRQVDQDGAAHYTPVRTVALGGAAGLSLYPNPTPGAATLSGAAAGALVQVLDALGRVVATATADANGTATLPAGLPAGVYVVRAGAQPLRLTVE
ncbi:T9SS type A sorting domain-containing protein [Hymenobacter sp. RP-2-7]|uniref:T9SS type A sorting domain-containing protein n=1 Tax=Hymenobacter polaris TaxID=2682546 RepID=A0A7Y0AF54_9BACT|nr:LamG-like jellyroll fold domain-containing protein [Hymenobacter polaris]NML66047.1 T9SS type A sorting domain-containing protein [Hymenobacter polaris]